MIQRAVSSIKWLLWAVTWLFFVQAGISIIKLLIENVIGVEFELEGLAVVPFIAGTAIAWIYVLKNQWSLKWPLAILGASLASMGTLIGSIGFGKLFIESYGRRNIYAASRLRAAKAAVPPRGLVEYQSDD